MSQRRPSRVKAAQPEPIRAIVRRKPQTLQTGPKSFEGKAVSSRNAIKHGLQAKDLILPHLGETVRQYRQHLAQLVESLQPTDPFQYQIVNRIAQITWRQDRSERYRVAATQFDLGQVDAVVSNAFHRGDTHITAAKLMPLYQLPDSRRLRKVDKHEAHNMKMLRQHFTLLNLVQSRSSVKVTMETIETQKGSNEMAQIERRHRSSKRIRIDDEQVI